MQLTNTTHYMKICLCLVGLSWLFSNQLANAEPGSAIPRNAQFSNLNTELGLSSEFVHDVEQDQLGFMWFATQSGLNRFDGFKVRIFENHKDDPVSLSHNFVWDIHAGQEGKLWIGTERGINLYVHNEDHFVREPFPGLELANYRIRQIAEDRRGNLWLGTLGEGLLKIDRTDNSLTQYKQQPDNNLSLPGNHIMALLVSDRGELWVGTDGGGMARFDAGQERFIRHSTQTDNPNSLSDNRIRRLFEDSRGHIWVGTAGGGLNLFEPESGRFTRYQNDPELPLSLPAGQVSGILEDSFGTLWIGTESGLAEWRPDESVFVRYQHDLTDANSLINNRVNVINQDASGVLWIGTHNGVSSWNFLSDTFTYFRSKDGYLHSDLVTHVAETSEGVLWVSTYGGGLSSINPLNAEVHHYRFDESKRDSLPDDRVMVVYVDRKDRVWVGTRGGGLALKNPDNSFTRFTQNADDPMSLSDNAVTSILEDSHGALWIGTFGGGLNFSANIDRPEFVHLQYDANDPNSLSGNRVLKIYEDRDGNIWVGTEGNGLNRVEPKSKVVTRYNLDPRSETNRPRGTPWEIFESPDRSLWLGTLGQGLLRWTPENRSANVFQLDNFDSSNGLASDIYGVVPGDSGELWLSSNRGLFEFDTTSNQHRKFDRRNGLVSNEFSQGARLRSRSGQVMFGSNSGLVSFFPGGVLDNERVPVVAIEASSRTDALARTWTGGEVPEIRLEYFDAFIAFEFVALDFVSPDKNEYRYRLVGLDSEWNIAQDYRQAIYSSLPPGGYTFQVEASNNDGVWNRHKSEIDVVVVPPPWSSWWAYLIYGLLAFTAAALVYNNQRAKRAAEVATRLHLERVVSERTAELAERNTELESLNTQLEHASVTDALTGLRNRRYVDEHMAAELSKLRRSRFDGEAPEDAPEMIFLMMIDLDGFKSINDQFGHQAGDKALLGVKDRLLAASRKSDVVVRWGGDEFLIIGHANHHSGIEQFAEKIRVGLSLTDYDVGDDNRGILSGSIGVAPIPFVEGKVDFADWEQICRIADAGAYLAKDSGRNAWVSIVGGASCKPEDLADLRENLGDLLEQRKLRLRSSRTLTHILA